MDIEYTDDKGSHIIYHNDDNSLIDRFKSKASNLFRKKEKTKKEIRDEKIGKILK